MSFAAQPHRAKLTETLWQAAVELARQRSASSAAHPLRLDYMGLRKRLDGVPGPQKKMAALASVCRALRIDECLQEVKRMTRFLSLPWVRVEHLASHILGGSAASVTGPLGVTQIRP